MHHEKRCFRLTAEGHSVWRMRASVPLPLDYRRILGLVEYSGHAAVIHSGLARLPADEVEQLLAEFQAMRLIERVAAVEPDLADIAHAITPPPIEPEDYAACSDHCSYVDASLSRLGVYVAAHRASRRAPCIHQPQDIVVLHVDDDPDQRALAAWRLNGAGYPVCSVDGVRSCYEFLAHTVPDAVFLDVDMADGDGLQVLSVLRRHPAFAFLPIVMLTARDAREDIVRGLALGADGYVTKSYRANTLDYVLRYVLQQEVTAGALETPQSAALV